MFIIIGEQKIDYHIWCRHSLLILLLLFAGLHPPKLYFTRSVSRGRVLGRKISVSFASLRQVYGFLFRAIVYYKVDYLLILYKL